MTRHAGAMDPMPPEALLDDLPAPMRMPAETLRDIVREALPTATERVRAGWRVIGIDVPIGRRSAYVAWIFPQPEHVHLGFPQGWVMRDPEHLLDGAGITKRARWLTFVPGDEIDRARCAALLDEAVETATLSRDERALRALDA